MKGLRTILAFTSVYIIWGSTYLAIRYAVAEIPPLVTAGTRHLVAGVALYTWALARGKRATRLEWRDSFVVGALFFLIGHGTLHWAEQTLSSGLAALLVATEPLWIAALLAIFEGTPLTSRTLAGLLLGLLGVALLGRSDVLVLGRQAWLGGLAVLIGAASWGGGVVYSRRATLPADPILRTGTTLLAGAVLLLLAAVGTGEVQQIQAPSSRALAALAYLIVFGSVIAFSSYFWLLERYSPTLVATHTYVNPVVAVLIGWAMAGEPATPALFVAMAVIVAAVAVVGSGAPARRVAPRSRVGQAFYSPDAPGAMPDRLQ
jgi:drug/metabolite transporter (DMT)-like permease